MAIAIFGMDGRTLYSNGAHRLGLTLREAIERTYRVIDLDGDPVPVSECPVDTSGRLGIPVPEVHLGVVRRGADPAWVTLAAVPLLESGVRVGTVAIFDLACLVTEGFCGLCGRRWPAVLECLCQNRMCSECAAKHYCPGRRVASHLLMSLTAVAVLSQDLLSLLSSVLP